MAGDLILEMVTDLKAQVAGLTQQVSSMQKTLGNLQSDIGGNGGHMGVRTKVAILWRTYVWLLCSLSALAGSFITWVTMQGVR